MPPRFWLSPTHPLAQLLRPLAWVYGGLRQIQDGLYRLGIFKTHRLSVPVIVVGNVIAGGVGKTPVVIELVNRLVHMGYQPGVVSRGYGRKSKNCQLVHSDSTAADVGDEPLLIARSCQVPVAVASARVEAAKAILAAHPECNVLVSDDGLQHLALGRDIEIVVFDERSVGNNYLLPAGPLREPWPRQPHCLTHLVLNHVPRSVADYALNQDGGQHSFSELRATGLFAKKIHALAGIAKPEVFFQMLRDQQLNLESTTSFADHDDFAKLDLSAQLVADAHTIWLCTTKDAMKLWPRYAGAQNRILAVPMTIDLDVHFLSVFDATIQSLMQSTHHATKI